MKKESKQKAVRTVSDEVSDADIRKLLAVHARTQKQAQSLIDKVHALKTDCRALLNAMSADNLTEA